MNQFNADLISASDAVDGFFTRIAMCQIAFPLIDAESLLMAKTYRQSHVRDTSGMAPAPDIPAEMSPFNLFPSGVTSCPDVTDYRGIR